MTTVLILLNLAVDSLAPRGPKIRTDWEAYARAFSILKFVASILTPEDVEIAARKFKTKIHVATIEPRAGISRSCVDFSTSYSKRGTCKSCGLALVVFGRPDYIGSRTIGNHQRAQGWGMVAGHRASHQHQEHQTSLHYLNWQFSKRPQPICPLGQ